MVSSLRTSTVRKPVVLADIIPGAGLKDAILVFSGAVLTVIAARISIPLPPSPVPITGQTFAVVVVGASLGASRGFCSLLLYVSMGLFLPVYSNGTQGWDVLWGATGGYLIAFPIAAALIGFLAEKGADRKPLLAFLTFALGQLVIFGIGVPWLKVVSGMGWDKAIYNGMIVFIIGGLIKSLLAGITLPLVWRLLKKQQS